MGRFKRLTVQLAPLPDLAAHPGWRSAFVSLQLGEVGKGETVDVAGSIHMKMRLLNFVSEHLNLPAVEDEQGWHATCSVA